MPPLLTAAGARSGRQPFANEEAIGDSGYTNKPNSHTSLIPFPFLTPKQWSRFKGARPTGSTRFSVSMGGAHARVAVARLARAR